MFLYVFWFLFQYQHLKMLLLCSSCHCFVISTDKLLTSLSNPLVFIGPVDKDKQQLIEKSSFKCSVRQVEADPKRIGRATGQRNHDLLATVQRWKSSVLDLKIKSKDLSTWAGCPSLYGKSDADTLWTYSGVVLPDFIKYWKMEQCWETSEVFCFKINSNTVRGLRS